MSQVYPDVSGRNATYEGLVLGMGSTSYWTLGETNGTVAEDLAGNDDGTYNNNTLGVSPGPIARVAGGSRAASFNGTSSSVEIGAIDEVSVSNPYTITVWIKSANTATTNQKIVSITQNESNRNVISVDANFLVTNNYSGEFNVQSTAFTDTTLWHHVAIVHDGSLNVSGYLDGASFTGSHTDGSNSSKFGRIGSNRPGDIGWFDGLIAHVAIFPYALTPAQIESLYLCGLSGQ